MYDDDEAGIPITGAVRGHTCYGTDRTADCKACDAEQAIAESSAFEADEWESMTEPQDVAA